MNPQSSIVRRLSSRNGSRHTSDDPPEDRQSDRKSETGSGADNKAYDPGSEVRVRHWFFQL